MSFRTEIRRRLAALSSREQVMAAGAGVIVLVYAGYLLIWQPLQHEQARLRQSLQVKRETQQYLVQAAQRAAELGGQPNAAAALADNQIPSILQQSSSQLQLAEAIKQQQAQTPRQIALTLEQAPFDNLMVWLATLAEKHGAQVTRVQLSQHGQDLGWVDGELVLAF